MGVCNGCLRISIAIGSRSRIAAIMRQDKQASATTTTIDQRSRNILDRGVCGSCRKEASDTGKWNMKSAIDESGIGSNSA